MRAAVMRDRRIVVDEIPAPVPGPGEVLVRTLACGICGSDLHTLKHAHALVEGSRNSGGSFEMDLSRDIVMGHEFCAEILTPASSRFRAGDRVVSVPLLLRDGRALTVGYSDLVPGGYAEQMVLQEDLLIPVPNGLASDLAALTEPMAVGRHAVVMSRITPAEVPLVIGCGPVGLAVIQSLKALGMGPVIAADFSPARRAKAELLGADIVIDPATESPYASWADLAGRDASGAELPPNPLTGRKLYRNGVYFECVGVPGVIGAMMQGAERGSRIVVVGVCMESDVIEPLVGINKELNLQFVLGYTGEEFAETLQDISEGKLDVEPMITGKVDIAGVPRAFEDLADPEKHAKILVKPA